VTAPDIITRRRRWAYSLIRKAAEPPPTYGTPGWLALPESDPVKVAGVVVAAEAWAQAGDQLEPDLRAEVEALRRGFMAAEDREYQVRDAEHRKRWAVPTRATFVQRRAEQLADVAPRPGDWPGSSGGAA